MESQHVLRNRDGSLTVLAPLSSGRWLQANYTKTGGHVSNDVIPPPTQIVSTVPGYTDPDAVLMALRHHTQLMVDATYF